MLCLYVEQVVNCFSKKKEMGKSLGEMLEKRVRGKSSQAKARRPIFAIKNVLKIQEKLENYDLWKTNK